MEGSKNLGNKSISFFHPFLGISSSILYEYFLFYMYVCKYCVEIKILKENSSGFSMNIESNGTFFTKIVNQREQKVLHGDVISKFKQIIRHIS